MGGSPAQAVVRADPERLGLQDHLTFKANLKHGRHGWLRLTPAYSVTLVQDLVRRGSDKQVVLDPFCGTGTTALVSAQEGIPCSTVDINPFLVWLANLKCRRFTSTQAERFRIDSSAAIKLAARKRSFATLWVPPIKDIDKWWDQPTLEALAKLFAALPAVASGKATQELLQLAFNRALIETANVSFGHQSMSFKKPRDQQQLLFFAEGPVQKVTNAFQNAAATITKAISIDDLRSREVQALLGDSRDLPAVLGKSSRFTTVITSPPYPNRMSYIRELRPYMYWLGYLKTGKQAGELDWQAIGGTWGCATAYLGKWTSSPWIKVPHRGLDRIVEAIHRHSQILGTYVYKYFEDMVQHVDSLTRVLSPGARVYYVVGNSKFYDVLLPTEEVFASLFRSAGFEDVAIHPIRKRTSKKELFEFVVSATWASDIAPR